MELHAKIDIPHLPQSVCVSSGMRSFSHSSVPGVFAPFVILRMALSGLKLHALSSTSTDALAVLS